MGSILFLCSTLTPPTAAQPPLYRNRKRFLMLPVEGPNHLHGPVDMNVPATASALLLKALSKLP